MWDYLLGLSDKEISLIGLVLCAISIVVGIKWSPWNGLKKLINFIFEDIKNFFMILKSLLIKIKSSTHNWLREKIVGKENLELLKKLEILKGNKRAIEFLDSLNKEDEYSKVNGGYEALWIFTRLYSKEMDFSEFKEAYEDDRKQGNNDKINELRKETLKKLIKNILNN